MERYRLPIPWDAVPTEHRPPLKRIDPAVPQGYPKVITSAEVAADGGREPNPHKYQRLVKWHDCGLVVEWVLKKEFH
jgi:hypothetical protein